jgi:DNA methylase
MSTSRASFETIRRAALDQGPVNGLTHRFYRYPARFSPVFARTAIQEFSSPGQIVLDPFVGGGTTVVEALRAGRLAAGCDVNPLSAFLTKVKVTPMTTHERDRVLHWSTSTLAKVNSRSSVSKESSLRAAQEKNLNSLQTRALKSYLAAALESISDLPSTQSRNFARCCIVSAAQWALDGREQPVTLAVFRRALPRRVSEMLAGIGDVSIDTGYRTENYVVETRSATELADWQALRKLGDVDLVVTSPPYAGIHVLYHRWQVAGRRETAAPYWLAGQVDGNGGAYYTFGHHQSSDDIYFQKAAACWEGIRTVVRRGAIVIQLVAFADPDRQLRRYLRTMDAAGFREIREKGPGGSAVRRTRRTVPGRRWHATLKGRLRSAREILLLHESR